MPRFILALNNLRGLVIVIVLAFHSVLAYLSFLPAAEFPFDTPPYRWLSFPVVDSHRWFGFDLFCAFQDLYLMSLMFFLSGLFVWASLRRKGSWTFLYDRFLRLGLPFALVVFLLMPIAYYPTYRITAADPSVPAFLQHWFALPFWPSGPPWFLWQLLVFDIAAAGLHWLAPNCGIILGRLGSSAGAHPMRFFTCLIAASALAYVPMAVAFTPGKWSEFGPFAFQLSRPLHYAVYFFAGVGIGASGLGHGLLTSDGILARRWPAWLAAMLVAIMIWAAPTARIMAEGATAPLWLQLAANLGFVLSCGAGCFFLTAAVLRFGNMRLRLFDSLSDNSYGIFLVHYVFIVWLQYALLDVALFAIAKAMVVFAGTLLLSWTLTIAMRGVLFGARVVGSEQHASVLQERDNPRGSPFVGR
jgi:surface polysaccharide O-acyltransferase-like enzyme